MRPEADSTFGLSANSRRLCYHSFINAITGGGLDMTDKDIRSEIEEIRAQLELLSREGGQGPQTAPAAAEPHREETAGGGAIGGWLHDILKQAEELWVGLDLQLKDIPAKTALVIFALGVLTGRLLSKKD
jgi:hypothetical protein